MESHVSRILMKYIPTSAGAGPSTHRRHRGGMQSTRETLKITHILYGVIRRVFITL